MRSILFSGAAALISSSIVTANTLNDSPTRADEPCAQVSSMVAPIRAANPRAIPLIDGQLAFDCLASVPLHSDQALAVTGSLLPYVQFQSDLSFKKKPPANYEYPAIDLVQSITTIRDNLENKKYANEYDWQMDMFKTFMAARDGHFRYAGDLISKPVRFTRSVSLVSVSMDGTSIPQLYTLDDIQRMQRNTAFKPSAITKINGQDAVTFVQTEADRGFQQDKDAAWNTIMYNPALDITPGLEVRGFFNGDGRYGFFYPGASTTLTFANSSTTTYQTKAFIRGNFTGVTNGETAFQKFCTNPKTVAIPTSSTTPAPAPTQIFHPGDPVNTNSTLLTPKNFPRPQVISSDMVVAGYYLNSTENKDVGVLSLNSFDPIQPAEFQAVMQTMLAEMKRDGKTKLIVDLQGNGGGIILNGYDAFRQLFPKTQEQLFARQRIHSGFTSLAQITSDRSANYSANRSDISTINLAKNHYNFRFDLNQDRKQFSSFDDKFKGPTVNGDMFSNLQQWDFNDPILTLNGTTGVGMDITGYGTRTGFTQPFAAENIVMLYDGFCASTCTLFSEMMRTQGNVKSIMLGGRPTSKAVQGIGGVKGSQALSFDSFFRLGRFFLHTNAQNQLIIPGSGPDNTGISTQQQSALLALSDLPQNRSLDNGVNFSDNVLLAQVRDGTGTPAQFIREEANCRLFMTPAMVTNITATWEKAASVAWRGQSCVVGAISEGLVSPSTKRSVPSPLTHSLTSFLSPSRILARARAVEESTVDGEREGIETRSQEVVRQEAEAAVAARGYLESVQGGMRMGRVGGRMRGWADLHGRRVPGLMMGVEEMGNVVEVES